jgi:Zn-dependent peptidase ImmA (M78 family)
MNRSECEEKASEIYERFNPDNLSPFPFGNIVKEFAELSIAAFPFEGNDLEKLSGAILYSSEKKNYRILINIKKPEKRQYFTVAHELGHYFLHKEFIIKEGIIVDAEFFDGSRALFRADDAVSSPADLVRNIETEANAFAAALLMPAHLVKEAWSELQDVVKCADIFNVSTSAMSIRLEKLGCLPT